MSFKKRIISVTLFVLCVTNSVTAQTTPTSPCPNIFKYQYDTEIGEYWGLVQVPSQTIGSTLHLTVNLTVNARLPSVSAIFIFINVFCFTIY